MAKYDDSSSSRNLATLIALVGMTGIGLAFLFLVAMILPGLAKMVFVPVFFVLFLALHYITWGRSLMRQKARYDAEVAKATAKPNVPPHDVDG